MSTFNVPKPPLIPANVNIDNNSTRLMKTKTTEASLSITDGIATIENGYISNLFNPVNDNEIATKYYVDNFGGSSTPGGPNNSIQINDGLFPAGFTGYPNFTFNGSTMTVDNLTNGTMTVSSGRIGGLVDPILPQQAATKNYVDVLTNNVLTQVTVEDININYTAAQFINTVINRTFIPNVSTLGSLLSFDLPPSISDIKTFLGSKFQVGYSWTTLIIYPKDSKSLFFLNNLIIDDFYKSCPIFYIDAFVINIPTNAVQSMYFSSVFITSVIKDITPGAEKISAYVTSIGDVTQRSQITNQGILTKSFSTTTPGLTVIMPITNSPSIISSISQLYTYQILQKQLIVRSGLTGITTDNIDSVANIITNDVFLMGGGTFTISIQNISAFNLIIGLGIGWSVQSGNSLTIPPNHCGNFTLSINLSTVTGIIRNLGILPLNGP